MKDMRFQHDVDEDKTIPLEDEKNGEILLQEILESFERFNRELGNTIQEFFPLDGS
ncbi:hypothetical protein AB3N59_06205 [Leptospira sp. WS92.C1]